MKNAHADNPAVVEPGVVEEAG